MSVKARRSRIMAYVLPVTEICTNEGILRARLAHYDHELKMAVWDLARFYSRRDRVDEAETLLARLQAWWGDSEKVVALYVTLGDMMRKEHRYATAAFIYGCALGIVSPDAGSGYSLHTNRAYCLHKLGRHREAEIHCRAALATQPAGHEAHMNLGLALTGQGRYEEAIRCFLEADRLYPENGESSRHLMDLLSRYPNLLDDSELAEECESLVLMCDSTAPEFSGQDSKAPSMGQA